MIYDWYSGSDSTKQVPRELARLKREGESVAGDQTIAVLRGLLKVERDPNWRGYLLWRIGREHFGAKRPEEAVTALLDAKAQFDPFLPTMRDLIAEYCDTLYNLIVEYYFEKQDMATVAEFAVTITANFSETDFTDFDKAMVCFYQGIALAELAKKHSLEFLHPLVLATFLRWHRLAPDEPACFEHLAYSYFYVGDMERSGIAAKMCLEVAPEGEIRDRVETFLREHAGELGGSKGTR